MAQGNPKPSRVRRIGSDREDVVEPVLEQPAADPATELRRAIEASRQQITQNLEVLNEEVHDRLDWKGWVREHPWEAVGAAFCLGLFLGARPYL